MRKKGKEELFESEDFLFLGCNRGEFFYDDSLFESDLGSDEKWIIQTREKTTKVSQRFLLYTFSQRFCV